MNEQVRGNMTNAEKFKEVFGIEIDEQPDDICGMANHNICIDHNCTYACPCYKFWSRKYKKKEAKNDGD